MTKVPERIIPSLTRIGWIGTGVMGSSMCSHVMAAGYRATLHSRTKAKAQPLLDLGATWAENPRAVTAESDPFDLAIRYRIVSLSRSGLDRIQIGINGYQVKSRLQCAADTVDFDLRLKATT